ncbi:MAG: ImmA/IrrE family metallo-endopeptidase [Desulfobaccales bacterium]
MDYSAFKCKWIDQNQLRELAEQKRQKYWPEGILPVDTTKIIELRLRLEVEPMFDLLSTLDVDAYLKTDLSGIVVDHDCYMNDKFLNRLRFSMAHELGHYFLHREIYSSLSLSSPEDWKEFIQNVHETEYEAFEYQANEFAGRFLVPYEKLKSAIMDSLEMIKKVALNICLGTVIWFYRGFLLFSEGFLAFQSK